MAKSYVDDDGDLRPSFSLGVHQDRNDFSRQAIWVDIGPEDQGIRISTNKRKEFFLSVRGPNGEIKNAPLADVVAAYLKAQEVV